MKRAKVWFVTPADKCQVRVCIHHKNGKRVVSRIVYKSQDQRSIKHHFHHVCVCVCWDQPSGGSKTPVTLRDSTNEWSGTMLWSLIV